jgi:hypothetical protein
MTDDTEKIIDQQKLENGIELFMYDRSRVIAGDRWQVELECKAYMPIDESYWGMVDSEDSQLLRDIKKILGDRMEFVTTRQRNFIDEKEYEAVLQGMVQQISDFILKYMKKPYFPQEFFKKQYREAHQKLIIQKAMTSSQENC